MLSLWSGKNIPNVFASTCNRPHYLRLFNYTVFFPVLHVAVCSIPCEYGVTFIGWTGRSIKELSHQMWLNIARRFSSHNLKKYNFSRRNKRSRQARSDMSTALLEKFFSLMTGTFIIYHWKGKGKCKRVNVHSNKRKRKVGAEYYTSVVSITFWDPMTSQSRDVNKHGGGVHDLWTRSDVTCKQRWRMILPLGIMWFKQIS